MEAIKHTNMTDTSHLEDRQTPEMVSNQIKVEAEGKETPEKTEAEQKPEDKAEVVPEKENEPANPKPEDKPEEVKPEDKSELQTKARTIYEAHKEVKQEKRELKSENEILKSQLAERDQLIEDLTLKAQNAETPAEKEEVADEIKEIAEAIGADPDGIAKLTDFLTKKMAKPDGVQISQEDLDAIKGIRQTKAQQEALVQFTGEWNKFEPSLKVDFPHVSNEELTVVKEFVDKLAHSPKYHDKEVDYIYFKEKATLEKLISPKRQSYEGSDNRPAHEGNADVELSGRSSPMDAMRATERQHSALDIRHS